MALAGRSLSLSYSGATSSGSESETSSTRACDMLAEWIGTDVWGRSWPVAESKVVCGGGASDRLGSSSSTWLCWNLCCFFPYVLHVLFQFHTNYILLEMSMSKFKRAACQYRLYDHQTIAQTLRMLSNKVKKKVRVLHCNTLSSLLLAIIGFQGQCQEIGQQNCR